MIYMPKFSYNYALKRFCQGVCDGSSYPCPAFIGINTDDDVESETDSDSDSESYPWGGGEIKAFWYWEGNYASSSGSSTQLTDQGWYTGVSAPQSTTSSNLISTTSGTFTYYGNNSTTFKFPSGLNSLLLFVGYSNANLGLGQYYLYNYTMNTQMLNDAYTYFGITTISQANSNNQLIGMAFGGGNTSTGEWTTGVPTDNNPGVGGIYSIYQNCTISGQPFTYTETGTGITQTGTGTCVGYTSINSGPTYNGINSAGLYSLSQFNCLVFDIEDGSSVSEYETSTGQDFLNLFEYIKTNNNSVFVANSLPVIIIVTISHSCSENIGYLVIGPILSANPCYYDYISPQLYTCNIGTTNEYCANSQIPWSPNWNSNTSIKSSETFTGYLEQNATYLKYGLNMILPSINYSNLYTGSGTNPYPYYPNLYYYETDYTSQDSPPAPTNQSSSTGTIGYTNDKGAVDFFTTMFGSTSTTLGGYIEWVNGSAEDSSDENT